MTARARTRFPPASSGRFTRPSSPRESDSSWTSATAWMSAARPTLTPARCTSRTSTTRASPITPCAGTTKPRTGTPERNMPASFRRSDTTSIRTAGLSARPRPPAGTTPRRRTSCRRIPASAWTAGSRRRLGPSRILSASAPASPIPPRSTTRTGARPIPSTMKTRASSSSTSSTGPATRITARSRSSSPGSPNGSRTRSGLSTPLSSATRTCSAARIRTTSSEARPRAPTRATAPPRPPQAWPSAGRRTPSSGRWRRAASTTSSAATIIITPIPSSRRR